MDIRQLKYFVAIVEQNNNITRAAKVLNMAQPPLSQQLKSLEDQLGVKLFERVGKKLKLTSSGEVLYDRAISLIAIYNDAIIEVQDINEEIKGTLSIGVSGFYSFMVTAKIIEFYNLHPNITFHVITGDTNRLYDLLEKDKIDLAIVNLPIAVNRAKFSLKLLNEINFSLYVSKDSIWNENQKTISFSNIKNIPLILTKREEGDGGTFDAIIEECQSYGFQPKIISVCNDVQSALALVNSGLGATILPDNMLDHLNINTVIPIEIIDTKLTIETAILWSKNRYLRKSVKNFLALFEEIQHQSLNNIR